MGNATFTFKIPIMEYRQISNLDLNVSIISLGTWAFGSDKWWGKQNDADSESVLEAAIASGINTIDTAPVYGRGHSEKVIGAFLNRKKIRENVILATKVGLSWQGSKILHNLKKKRMVEELDESRKRLQTDYLDIYQVHWPDPDTPIAETAATMNEFYQKGIVKAVGVSNYSVEQMTEFLKYCPLHSLQPQYSMFERSIEKEIIPFCIENKISIITYAPLYAGILTGKFFFDKVSIPNDINRKMKKADLEEPMFSINKETLRLLKAIASKYSKTLTQLAINWNFNQAGITSAITGMRKLSQLQDNLGSLDWKMSNDDASQIEAILSLRLKEIKMLNETSKHARQ